MRGTEMTDKIEVLDAICGSGKSSHIFNYINDNPHQRYIYVTPLLSEVHERVPNTIKTSVFYQPQVVDDNSKIDNLLELLTNGDNISCTHSLFRKMTKEHLKQVALNDYILIIDEEVNLIDSDIGVRLGDIEYAFIKGMMVSDEGNLGAVKWIDTDFEKVKHKKDTTFLRLKQMCDIGVLFSAKRKQEMLTIHLPIALVTAAYRVIICTYLFEGSILDGYLALKGIKRVKYEGFEPCNDQVKQSIKALITVAEHKHQKEMDKLSLSYSWYTNADKSDKSLIASAVRWCGNQAESAEKFMFTTPKSFVCNANGTVNVRIKDFPATVKGKSTPNTCWIYSAARATNDFSHKNVLCHAYNRYPTMPVESYLRDYGFSVDRDTYAIAELVQWVFRSAVRNGQPIVIYFLNKRMRNLFLKWLNDGDLV